MMISDERRLKIIHIAELTDAIGGVNLVVPQHVKAQQSIADVELYNVTGGTAFEARSFPDGKSFQGWLDSLSCPDLVVFHEVYRPKYLKIYPYLLHNAIPYIIIPHGGLTKKAQSIKLLKKKTANFLLFTRFIRNALAIQCLSEREMNETKWDVHKFVGTNGIDIQVYKESFSNGPMQIIYIGRLDLYIKGLDLLVEAISMEATFLREKGVHVNLYGPDDNGVHQKLEKMITKAGVQDIVDVGNAVTGVQKQKLMLAADCFIQTSRSEGMSMSILEALGTGLPCILTEGTGMGPIVYRYDAGWECKTEARDIARSIHEACSSRELLPAKSKAAMKLVQENFSWEIIAKDTVLAYRSLLQL